MGGGTERICIILIGMGKMTDADGNSLRWD
jgi:hypothetical protein